MKEIVNRRATYEFQFIQEYDAGIMLMGTEIKALRLGNANLSDAYCVFKGSDLYVRSIFIAEYEFGNVNNHEERRERKLLLRKSELAKLQKAVKEKGLTIIPYKIFFSDRGIAKVRIALAQGKKTYDKRSTLKEKDVQREMDRVKKTYS